MRADRHRRQVLRVLQCRGAERSDRQVGSQVQDRAGQLAGSRGTGEEGKEEHDARGTAEGAAAGSDEVEGTDVTLEWRRMTVAEGMAGPGGKDKRA